MFYWSKKFGSDFGSNLSFGVENGKYTYNSKGRFEMKITIQTSNEEILKESLLDGIDMNELLVIEGSGKTPEGKAVKVYGKLAGLNCIGRLNFVYGNEISEKVEYANTQLMQKYGDEIYGKSGQAVGGNNLITCNVKPLMQLPDKFVKEASDNGAQELGKFTKQLADELVKASKNAEWARKHKDVNDLIKILNQINPAKGVDANKDLWKKMNDKLKTEPWASDIKNREYPFNNKGKNLLEMINDAWTKFTSASLKDKSGNSGGRGNDKLGKETSTVDNEIWNPRQTYKIEIKTNFNEDWYKKRFKSGFLNKIIFAIKTDARSHSSPDHKNDMTNHKYTADEMLPQDKRKLDSIKWKMTNKVAKDFISLFCGWSRSKKEMYQEQGDSGAGIVYVPTKESILTQDKGFGDSMAKKALNDRGIFGRLKNALFAGGTDGSTITVAFQLDDPHNGWTIVEKKDVEGQEGEDGGGESSSSSSSSSPRKNWDSIEGKGSTPFGLSSDSPMLAPISSEQAQQNPKVATGNLAARVKRIEDEVYGESTDPFYEDFMEERMELVKEFCEGKGNVDSLIEHYLLGD